MKEQATHKQLQNEALHSKLVRQRDVVEELIAEYAKGFQQIADAYRLRIEDYNEDGVFDKTVEFDRR